MATFNAQDGKGALITATVTIANGTALSPAVDLTAYTLVAIQLPAGWTAAGLTFQAANDNQNFGDVYDKNGEYDRAVPDTKCGHAIQCRRNAAESLPKHHIGAVAHRPAD